MDLKKILKKTEGFTLIELLIVIAIIVILAAVVFVALDPLKRFSDARDARRWSDADAIISAIKLYQVDNGGSYPSTVAGETSAQVYQIGTDATLCSTKDGAGANLTCDTAIAAGSTACIDLTDLVTGGYLAAIPVAPSNASATTPNTFSDGKTGYTITRTGNNITVASCVHEGSQEISIKR